MSILELKICYTKLIFSSKPLLKNDKHNEQEMPRAAKDLFRRQLAMKKKSTMKKSDKKKKKQGTNETVFYVDIQLNISLLDVQGCSFNNTKA